MTYDADFVPPSTSKKQPPPQFFTPVGNNVKINCNIEFIDSKD